MPHMPLAARSITVAVALAHCLALGCGATPTDAELAKVYRVGLTRGEAAALHKDPPHVVVRPSTGWSQRTTDPRHAAAFAESFEKKNAARVETCEVYWVPRGFAGMGVYWDYLFFGPDDR